MATNTPPRWAGQTSYAPIASDNSRKRGNQHSTPPIQAWQDSQIKNRKRGHKHSSPPKHTWQTS